MVVLLLLFVLYESASVEPEKSRARMHSAVQEHTGWDKGGQVSFPLLCNRDEERIVNCRIAHKLVKGTSERPETCNLH